MRAAVCTRLGAPDGIVVQEVPDPIPGAGEALVRIEAAGVNFADLLIIAGRYQLRVSPPFIPGLEFVGTVVALGSGVSGCQVGDRVMGAPARGGGCFAELVCMAADRLYAVPASMPLELAAGFIIGYGTAGFALERGALSRGERVLVTGAGGGVGLATIEVAARRGGRVIAAAGSAQKLDAARAGGADSLIDYRREDLRERVRSVTGGRGADLAIDLIGGAVFDAALHALAPGGRIVSVGFASGEIPRIPAEYLLLKNLSALGGGFGAVVANDPAGAKRTLDAVAMLNVESPLRAQIAAQLGLEELPAALTRLAAREVTGKLLVRPRA
jgi:NADPH:quinone reductase